MPINIVMPALSPTMETGNLAKWHVAEGDDVAIGDIIAEIETDKATMEVEAIDEGRVGRIYVKEGQQNIAVNSVIAILLTEGEDASALPDKLPVTDSVMTGKDDNNTTSLSNSPTSSRTKDEQTANRGGTSKATDITTNTDIITDGEQKQPATSLLTSQKRIFSTPLARKLAQLNNVDISHIDGSGPNGRVIKQDIVDYVASGKAGAKSTQEQLPGVAHGENLEQIKKQFPDRDSYELIPHDEMRRIIASRITIAKQTIPHFYLDADCRIDELLRLREQINQAAPSDEEGHSVYKISVNDMIIKALAIALHKVPAANVTWTPEAMIRHKKADIGVAVAIKGGLITPIVRDADSKSLVKIATEMVDYIKRARQRKLLPHEYQGGSSSISNLGSYGVDKFTAVINPPQSTILAVGKGKLRPIVDADGDIIAANTLKVVLSCDHRAVDGALGAQLLSAFCQVIEKPVTLLI